MSRCRRVALVGALIIGCVGAVAGTGPEEQPTPSPVGGLSFRDEVEVTVVNVDVYVRDRQGQPIGGLTRDDFRVFQDKVEMPLSHFAALSEEVFKEAFAFRPEEILEPTPLPRPAPVAEIKPIFVVVYVDNENLHPLDRNRALRQLREFVTDNLGEPMRMMVVSYQKTMEIVQPFTDDPQAVNAALRKVQLYSGGMEERDSAAKEILDDMSEEHDREGDWATSSHSGERRQSWQAVLRFADEEMQRLNESISALRQVVDVLAGLDGRKVIIYLSDGLPMVPGQGLMYEYAGTFRDNSILTHRSRYDRTQVFQSLVSAANAQEVTFYTIEAQGLQVTGGAEAESRYGEDPLAASVGIKNLQESLRFMANNTGGLAVVNTNDIAPGLAQVKGDLFTYYSLGYTITSSGADRVHRIDVQLPNHPQHEARYRRRFVQKSLESRVQDQVLSALMFEIKGNALELAVEAGDGAPATAERWTVPVHLSVPLGNLALIPEAEDYVGRVVVFVAARDNLGKSSDVQRQEHEVRVPAKDYQTALEKRFGIDVPLLMEAGEHTLAVGLMDQVTRQSSVLRMNVNVP